MFGVAYCDFISLSKMFLYAISSYSEGCVLIVNTYIYLSLHIVIGGVVYYQACI